MMPEWEYKGWARFLSENPPNVNEVQMAILLRSMTTMFGGKAELDDFIISPAYKSKDEKVEMTGEALEFALQGMFG